MDDFRIIILTILGLLVLGVPVGIALRRFYAFRKTSSRIVSSSVFAILFLLGAGLGSNDNLMDQLAEMSYSAAAITIGAFVGSALALGLVYRVFFLSEAVEIKKEGEKA